MQETLNALTFLQNRLTRQDNAFYFDGCGPAVYNSGMSETNRRCLKYAVYKTIPIAFSYFFIAVAFGIMMSQAGYAFYWSAAASLLIFSGAFEMVLASYLASRASLTTIALTALLMGSRHIFYGLPFISRFSRQPAARAYMIFTLTDEVFSLDCSLTVPAGLDETQVMFDIGLLSHVYWLAGSIAGGLLASFLPADLKGIDFCLTALFITIVIDKWRSKANRKPALIGLGCALLCLVLVGADNFILPALLATVGLLLLDQKISRKDAANE